jgi:hypothetical protein
MHAFLRIIRNKVKKCLIYFTVGCYNGMLYLLLINLALEYIFVKVQEDQEWPKSNYLFMLAVGLFRRI